MYAVSSQHVLIVCTVQYMYVQLTGKVMTGSHADAIVGGGPYDGALGVIGAIAAIKGLREEGFMPRKSIEAVMFTSEECDRFSEVCTGRCGNSLGVLRVLECCTLHVDCLPQDEL